MERAVLIYIFLLLNHVNGTQTSITNSFPSADENVLRGISTKAAVFPLQISGILAPAEAPPAASVGNNLNVVPAVFAEPGNLRAASDHFPAQSRNYRENKNKKYDGIVGDKSDFVTTENINSQLANVESDADLFRWKNCFHNQHNIEMEKQNTYMSTKVNKERVVHFEGQSQIKKQDIFRDNNFVKIHGIKTTSNSTEPSNNEDTTEDYLKYEKRRQLKTTSTAITNTVLSTTENIRATETVIGNVSEADSNDIEIRFIQKEIKPNDRFDSVVNGNNDIKFGQLPQKQRYLVPTLKLNQWFYPFEFLSNFFIFIHPFDPPIGFVNDIFWGKFSFPYSFLHSIKVESAFLALVIIICCLAMVIPSYFLILAILAMFSSNCTDNDTETGALFPDDEKTHCNDRFVTLVTLFLVMMCCLLLCGMVISNEQASWAVENSKDVLNSACSDIANWLSNSARELYHSFIPPVDLVVQAYKDDLRNIGKLLGEPIQKAISSESGIEQALIAVNDIVLESEDISSKISALRDVSARAGALSSATGDRLKDLAHQLDVTQRNCVGPDVLLCDTLNIHSLELRMKFDMILHEQQLLELRALGADNLTRATSLARQQLSSLPDQVVLQTTSIRKDILRDIETRREAVYHSARVLGDLVRTLTGSLHVAATTSRNWLLQAKEYDFWRWLVMLFCVITFGLVIMLILCAMVCSCAEMKFHAQRSLKVAVTWICLVSLLLWASISAAFLVAGHAEVYVCHALWDAPHYKMLSQLLDRPSPLLADNEGVFDALFRDLDNYTFNVPIADVLGDCERNQPAYTVFHLDNILDINKETSYFEWKQLQRDLGRLDSLNITVLRPVSADLHRILNRMIVVADVDFAKYRMKYSEAVIGKDLLSLAEQVETVAGKVGDLTTSGKLETLASRARKLQSTHVKQLENLRSDVVFKLTELELQLAPFRRKLNSTTSQIQKAQSYIDNRAEDIARVKVSSFVRRLASRVGAWRAHALHESTSRAARCRPLHDAFAAARTLLCSVYISGLHGWWVCGVLLGVLWCALTPLCVTIWTYHGRSMRAQEAMSMTNLATGPQGTPTTAMCESNNWSTPCPPPPPRSDSW